MARLKNNLTFYHQDFIVNLTTISFAQTSGPSPPGTNMVILFPFNKI